MQNAHRSGGALDNRGQQGAGQHAEQRVGKQGQNLCKFRDVGQRFHRTRHGVHPEHQNGKSQQDQPHVLLLTVFHKHIKNNAHDRQDRRKRRRRQHLDKPVITLNPGGAEKPGGHCRSHIGAHDDADGLRQLHQARVDKAHHHHRGRRGGLDNRRYASPQ